MRKELKHFIKQVINLPLSLLGFELVRQGGKPFTDYRDYIPFQETLTDATKVGLPVGDYIDWKYNQPGATQETITQMAAHGVFKGKIERICEIGPGSGRYLENTLKVCRPDYYEIYETATAWRNWLVQKYNVIAQPTDGLSLSHTASNSIDLIQAHKVMSGQPSLIICRYFTEMARVVREGGKVVFDIVTEDCLDELNLDRWLASKADYQSYPCLMPKQYIIDFFEKRGLLFDGSFFISMEPGKTECLVFTKKSL